MAVNLTKGAIAMVSKGDADLKPVLQVFDIRLVNTTHNTAERYRMLLSDGSHLQQAMLATQMNHIVKSGKLQKGSIVQLTEFICNLIQNRKIIIIINLEVIVEKCDLIGEPKQYGDGTTSSAPTQGRASMPAQSSSMDQSGIAAGNPQSYGGSLPAGTVTGQNVMSATPLHPRPDSVANPQSYGGSFSGPGRNATNGANAYMKAEPGVELSGSVSSSGSYSIQPQNPSHNNQSFSNPGAGGGSRPSFNSHGHPAQSTYNQPPPMYTNRGPIVKNEAPARIIPIAALNPYQGKWTIKARVTAKGELRRYNNPRGEGKVFSFDLLDSDGGEIRVTCFNAVADQFFDQIEVGRVYLISRGSLKPAQKNFNHLNNQYEIFLESTSTVQPCLEEDSSIPRQQFNFRPIADIEGMETNSMVDLIGIVSSISPSSTILRKNGTETLKRSLQLKDMSGRSVELTIWGSFCNAEGQQLQDMCDSGVPPVLAVKAARVNDFNGKTVGTISTSQLFINPDFPEAHRLKEWFDREGRNAASLSISREMSTMGRTDIRKTIAQIKDEGLGRSEKPDWITVKATVSFVKVDNFCYTACPLMVGDRKCSKKVNNNGDGTWHCERCDQSFPECDYRYLLQLQIQDHTGLTWVTAFQESGEEIMGITAKDLYLLKYEEQDDVRFGEIVRSVLFTQYLFKLKVKEETYSDEQRVKSTIVKAEKINFASESKYLLGLIDKVPGEDPSAFFGRSANVVLESGISNAGFRQDAHPVGNSFGTGGSDRYGVASANSVGPYGSAYSGVTGPVMGNSGVYLLCNSCGGAGHNSQNCPSIVNRQGQSMGGGFGDRTPHSGPDVGSASGKCFKCNQSGHWARDCPGSNSVPSSYGGSSASSRYGISNQQLGRGF
ncbi:replication protein A 70 kDa DNA-binding subunit A-like [Magnolia sinica]|uniref:replication protein A 70 kDa DNA-binding subunit A-like n=1 Tax=Magnolia sinica TaxID=86752 RepID=UPI00265857F1|nr:replication protein A 70 kDa DNA-binding subunit A-like [Magnolia sinica]